MTFSLREKCCKRMLSLLFLDSWLTDACVRLDFLQILVNPPRALLQARLEARAVAGAHFMPGSLLDSQLQQLEVPQPLELYMCFGDPPGSGGASCCSDVDSGGGSAAAAYCVHSGVFPSASEIVAAIVAKAKLVTSPACVQHNGIACVGAMSPWCMLPAVCYIAHLLLATCPQSSTAMQCVLHMAGSGQLAGTMPILVIQSKPHCWKPAATIWYQ